MIALKPKFRILVWDSLQTVGYHNAHTAPMPEVQIVRIKFRIRLSKLTSLITLEKWIDGVELFGGIHVYIFQQNVNGQDDPRLKRCPSHRLVRFFVDAGQTEPLGTSFHWFPCWRPWSYRIPTDHYLQTMEQEYITWHRNFYYAILDLAIFLVSTNERQVWHLVTFGDWSDGDFWRLQNSKIVLSL